MAINFAAANMAGWNNPKVEILTALLNPANNTLISAPSKAEISECINRGSLPFLMVTSEDRDALYILPFNYAVNFSTATFSFCGCVASTGVGYGAASVIYDFDDAAPPTFKLAMIQTQST